MNTMLRGLVLFCATVVAADLFEPDFSNYTWTPEWKLDVQAENKRELAIEFHSRTIRSSSPVLMRWTDDLCKRTIAEARDHVLRRMWASTLAEVHVK